MRLDHNDDKLVVVLSRRNLLTLLSKLYTKGSVCTIEGGTDCEGIQVKAEPDDVHYDGREVPRGPMHPTTEKALHMLQMAELLGDLEV